MNTMEVKKAYEDIEMYYKRIVKATTTITRSRNYESICEIIKLCPDVAEYWEIDNREYKYINKVKLVKKYFVAERESKIFHNIDNPLGNREVIPKESGLYLVSNTIFNPMTNEEFFMVKIGMSSNLYNRMKDYSISNPMMFHIDYKTIDCSQFDTMSMYDRRKRSQAYLKEIEDLYHEEMEKRNFIHFEYSREWFIVDRETYMEICEKKFDFFNLPIDIFNS